MGGRDRVHRLQPVRVGVVRCRRASRWWTSPNGAPFESWNDRIEKGHAKVPGGLDDYRAWRPGRSERGGFVGRAVHWSGGLAKDYEAIAELPASRRSAAIPSF